MNSKPFYRKPPLERIELPPDLEKKISKHSRYGSGANDEDGEGGTK